MRQRLAGAAITALGGLGVLAILILVWILFVEVKIFWQDLA